MFVVLRRFRDHDFRREQQAGDRGCVLQREARDIGRIQDAGVNHVAVLARAGVVTVRALATLDLVQHHSRVFASVLDDLTQRLFDRTSQDTNADRRVFVRTLSGLMTYTTRWDTIATSLGFSSTARAERLQ